MATNTSVIIVNGKIVGRGRGGGGGGIQFVDNLPIANPGEYTNQPTPDARDNVIYILKTNVDEGWWRSMETVPAVPGSFTDEDFDTPRPGYTYAGSADSDPDTDDLAVYYNRANDQWRRKDAGSLEHTLTSEEFEGRSGVWQGELDADPDTDDEADYFNTDTRRFRHKDAGSTSASITQSAWTRNSGWTWLGTHTGIPVLDSTVSEAYYRTSNGAFYSHGVGETSWSLTSANTISAHSFVSSGSSYTTEATVLARLIERQGQGTAQYGTTYAYYNSDDDDFYNILFNAPAPWSNVDFEETHEENNAGWLGDHGLPGSDGVDTVVEAVDFLNANSYDPTTIGNLYIGFYNTASGKVERITGFAIAVEWEDTTLMYAFNDGVVHWMGLQSTSDDVVEYLDENYESGPTFIYDDGTNIKVILTFTATVPEYDRPVMDRIPFSGDTTGVSQAVFDLLEDRVDELEDDIVGTDEDFPDASEDHQDTIKIVGRKAYTVEGYQTANVAADGDWIDYSHSHFQGAFADDPHGLLIQDNYYYNTSEHVWKRVGLERGTLVYLNIHDPLVAFGFHFVGEFSDEQAASDAISSYSSSNEYLAYFDGKINSLDSFTAAQSPQDAWRWVRIGADEAKRIAALEQQVSLHWSLQQPRTVITGNGSEQLEFDVSGLQRFLAVDNAYALLDLTLKYTPSATFEGDVAVQLQHGTTDVDSDVTSFTDDSEVTVELSGEIDDAADGLFITVAVDNSTDTSESVAFEDIDLEIVAGVNRAANADNVAVDGAQYGGHIPDTVTTLAEALMALDTIVVSNGGTSVIRGNYDSSATYTTGQVAFSGTGAYMSRQDSNSGNAPASSPSWWWRLDTPAVLSESESENANSTVGRLISGARLIAAINSIALTSIAVIDVDAASEISSAESENVVLIARVTTAFTYDSNNFALNDVWLYDGSDWYKIGTTSSTGTSGLSSVTVTNVATAAELSAAAVDNTVAVARITAPFVIDSVDYSLGEIWLYDGTDWFHIGTSEALTSISITEVSTADELTAASSDYTVSVAKVTADFTHSGTDYVVGDVLLYSNTSWVKIGTTSASSGGVGSITVTEVDDETELNAITTTDAVAFAKITTAFTASSVDYAVGEVWIYAGSWTKLVDAPTTYSALTESQITDPESDEEGLTTGRRSQESVRAHETYPWDTILDAKTYLTTTSTPPFNGGNIGNFTISDPGDANARITTGRSDLDQSFINSLLSNGVCAILDADNHTEIFRFTIDRDNAGTNVSSAIYGEITSDHVDLLTVGTDYRLAFTQGRPDVGISEDAVDQLIRDGVESWARTSAPTIQVPLDKLGIVPFQWRNPVRLESRDPTDTPYSAANFTVEEISNQDYVRFENTGLRQRDLNTLEVFTVIGFFPINSYRVKRLYLITGDSTDNGYPVRLIYDNASVSPFFVLDDNDLWDVYYTEPRNPVQRRLESAADRDDDYKHIINKIDSDGVVKSVNIQTEADNPYHAITTAQLKSSGDWIPIGYSARDYDEVDDGGSIDETPLYDSFYETYNASMNLSQMVVHFPFDAEGFSRVRSFSSQTLAQLVALGNGVAASFSFTATTAAQHATETITIFESDDGSGFDSGSDVTLIDPPPQARRVDIASIKWRDFEKKFELVQRSTNTDNLTHYFGTGLANDQRWYDKALFIRFADGTIHEISRDNISNFQASFLGASWFIESWDEQLIDKINDIAVGDSITIIVADRRSIDWMGERLYDGDLFVKFADDDVPIRLLPNNSFEYNVSWASDSVTSASRMITAGTDIQVSIYDEEGRSIYTADENRTILTELVQKQEAFPKFCHFQHQNMDDWAEDYAGSSIYPEDTPDDEDGRVNMFNIRKFILGEIYSSSNRGLPLPELDV